MTLPSRDDVMAWIGLPVHDSEGAPAGTCRNVFADHDSGLPEWVEVQLGSGDTVFAPTLGARLDDGVVHLAHALDVMDRSPRYTPDVDRTPDEEKALYEHYGVAWSDEKSDTLLPAELDDAAAPSAPRAPRLTRIEQPPTPTPTPSMPPPAPAPYSYEPPAESGGLPKAALVGAPAAAAALAGVGALVRRRRAKKNRPEVVGRGLAGLLAPLALVAVAATAWRRRKRNDVDVEVVEVDIVDIVVDEVPPMPVLTDRRTPDQTGAPY